MVAALLLVFAVRIWVFSIYSVPADNLIKGWKQGDRVMVNRLVSAPLKRGDKVIYTDSVYDYMAQIQAIPGDTITLKSILAARSITSHVVGNREGLEFSLQPVAPVLIAVAVTDKRIKSIFGFVVHLFHDTSLFV